MHNEHIPLREPSKAACPRTLGRAQLPGVGGSCSSSPSSLLIGSLLTASHRLLDCRRAYSGASLAATRHAMSLQGEDAPNPTAAPRAQYISLNMAIRRLANLAVGPNGRWMDRHGEESLYSADASVARIELWHTWATDRASFFTSSLPRGSRKRREIKLPIFNWLERKHQTLEVAQSSGGLLPVDVADQVVCFRRGPLRFQRDGADSS